MKNLKTLLFSILFLGIFAACDNGKLGPVSNTSKAGAPTISSPEGGQSYRLLKENADDTLLTMGWTGPDYGFSAAPTYTIQADSAGQDFQNPIQLGTVNKTSFSTTVGNMNNIMLGAGLPSEKKINMNFRIIASLSNDSTEQQVSDPISLGITAYSICKYCPTIYVPGSYQEASGYGSNWSPADAPSLTTVNNQDQYGGYVYMANADNLFKFTPQQNWSSDWGVTDADGMLDPGGDNIAVSNAGYYKVNVDLNAMTYTMTDTQWGLIGSATANGWDSDMDMTYDKENKVWTITTDLTADEIKFRANDAWDIAYGDKNGDGRLGHEDGNNIAINEAGNYTITLDLSKAPFTYELTKN